MHDYLLTTFALSDADARDALDLFLSHPESGMFKGPYARLRLPFRSAEPGWERHFDWYAGQTPYGHQAAAFARLSSRTPTGEPRRPQPTLVTTGTGSGKTEAFLYPILDHVRRARLAGVTGMKALILYPMNALANDQAQRLAAILAAHPEMGSVTAGLYTGQETAPRSRVSVEGLITDRAIMRESPPDILLTNYKMLDQLLLRADDANLWRLSADSLQYLVLDEFHTYDGAQGTDVAMLLRRLGLALAAQRGTSVESSDVTLGKVTPVATSATLGDGGDPTAMLGFARTVFGETFDADSVITESRLTYAEWAADAAGEVAVLGLVPRPVGQLDVVELRAALANLPSAENELDADAFCATVLAYLYASIGDDGEQTYPATGRFDSAGDDLLLVATKAHPLVHALIIATEQACAVDDLVAQLVGAEREAATVGGNHDPGWAALIVHTLTFLGHVRARCGRRALSLDAHLWVRELSRIDRVASSATAFAWGDDGDRTTGEGTDVHPSFPAVYCRHCGRSGWGVLLAPSGPDLDPEDPSIRKRKKQRDDRFRALIHAPSEADAYWSQREPEAEGMHWFSVRNRTLLTNAPAESDEELREGWVLPVLTSTGQDAAKDSTTDTCPACGQVDGIRFLGSAVATLLSVSLSTVFATPGLDNREKKALVFTDSVQDAAHRAGFIQARSHTMSLRSALTAAVRAGRIALDDLVEEAIRDAGDDSVARYRLVAPDCADRTSFAPFWSTPTLRSVAPEVRRRASTRLHLDAALEFGLQSRTGRTLELTGTVAAQVDAGPASNLKHLARRAIEGLDQLLLIGIGEERRVGWVRGVLERMRTQGAIDHPWFERYRADDGNRYSIWGGRPRDEGMPAFPAGRPAPAYPRIGKTTTGQGGKEPKSDGLDAVTSPQSWYARWSAQCLKVNGAEGGILAKLLIEALAQDNILSVTTSKSGARVYGIPPRRVLLELIRSDDLAAGRHQLTCTTCHSIVPGSQDTVAQLADGPCLTVRCHGTLINAGTEEGFYRRLYTTSQMRRVVACEHTSLLTDEDRLAYENGFKTASDNPQAPNVLVATPTLEMGIDIGDLSAVVLSSLPRTVASYLQRVGRAGRLTGNALNLALVTGRGAQLPQLGEPLSVINGIVRPPATYLSAEEILRRQFTAHLVDEMARTPERPRPRMARGVLGSATPDSFLGHLIAEIDQRAAEHLAHFIATFGDELAPQAQQTLNDWVTGRAGPGSSPFAAHLHQACHRWNTTIEGLTRRIQVLEAAMPDLMAQAESPAADNDDRQALRSAQVALKLTRAQKGHLSGEHWIAVLEEYGILPNYTLLDDGVGLDVGMSWMDPDTHEFHTDTMQMRRSASQAIAEFAPGATFYARGFEILIDALDLGVDQMSVRSRVFCPHCGFSADADLEPEAASADRCPRCGSQEFADVRQRLDVVELQRVTSELRRDESRISDRSDEREVKPFVLIPTADIDRAQKLVQWFVPAISFGVTYLNRVDVRWVNLGRAGNAGTVQIAGVQRPATLFRVCAECGKLDVTAGTNKKAEHRPWCAHRAAETEKVLSVALTRTLTTQGLVIRLPRSMTLGDQFAIPSLSAAVLLGLREHLGGHPDHIRVLTIIDPTDSDGSDNLDALLLHDTVPGGTGYLAELADPERLRSLLLKAWRIVRDCPCAGEDRLACHQCLMPFISGQPARSVSRAVAERHLRLILTSGTAEDPEEHEWVRTTIPPQATDPESYLEQLFRSVLLERLRKAGATLQETPGVWGTTVTITLPGSPRRWTLTPQLRLENSQPDFVLQSSDSTIPTMAIFTDGRKFHAVEACNRLGDDAQKRNVLRETGRYVLSLTAADLGDEPISPPDWYSAQAVGTAMAQEGLQASPATYDLLRSGPIEAITAWIADPRPQDQTAVARAVPLMLTTAQASRRQVPTLTRLPMVAAAELTGHDLSPVADGGEMRRVVVWRSGALAAAIEPYKGQLRIALVLDDRPGRLDQAHAAAWREWLRLSNALALRDWPTVITTVTQLQAAEDQVGPVTAGIPLPRPATPQRPEGLSDAWTALFDQTRTNEERSLLALMAESSLGIPTLGHESREGIPIDMCWPEIHLAVALDSMTEQDRADLQHEGWTVVEADIACIANAMSGSSS
nr:DEAD/DEAH box helicase [Kineosporia sp. NBRC 101677]